jgi:predicted DNA-binding transcriptional regulator YafY
MRADRLLSILLLLQTHGRMTGRQLAKRLEVSQRTIHRDMEALGAAGIPVVGERGVGGGWELIEGFRTSLTALSESEVNALFVTKPARVLADLHLDKASDAAVVKMLSVLPEVHRRNAELTRQRIHIDVTGWKHSSEPVTILPVLQDALWRDRRLRMTYDRGDGPTERVVAPLGLVAKGSVWYLVAAIDADVRSYRVSRIAAAEVLNESFVRPPEFDLAAFWERSSAQFREKLPRVDVIIRADVDVIPALRTMVRFGAVDGIEGEQVRMHFDNEDAARHSLVGFGASVEVIAPQSLRDAIRETARSIVDRDEPRR